MNVSLEGYDLMISPVGNYTQQANQLLRYGANLRTSWIEVSLTDADGNRPFRQVRISDLVTDMLTPISLALGFLVTSADDNLRRERQ